MNLTIKPFPTNTAPLGGLLVRGSHVAGWLRGMQDAGLSLASVTAYALPEPGSSRVWGCLVTHPVGTVVGEVGAHQLCQVVGGLLFVPERAVLYPQLSVAELDRLLVGRPHLLHPDTGLIELVRVIDWADALADPVRRSVSVQRPAPTAFVPMTVRSFQVQATPPEAVLERLEEQAFPKRESLDKQPLSPVEKAKRWAYRHLLGKPGDGPSAMSGVLDKVLGLFGKGAGDWLDKAKTDQADLEERNQRAIDRLLDLLKINPAEALRYALPLDETGTGRGPENGQLGFNLRWADLSLFGRANRSPGAGGNTVLPEDTFAKLRAQYGQTAEGLLAQGDWQKAAFVYLKLLKNYPAAADALERGQLYAEAASVWLKYANDKLKAAQCYQKANMTEAAIDLYVELGQHEQAGDLYASIDRPAEARHQYQTVIDGYTDRQQYVKAAQVCRDKLHDHPAAQFLLLTGWQTGRDAANCLNSYLTGFADATETGNALQAVYTADLTVTNRELFLQVIRHQTTRHPSLAEPITDMAHEIIAAALPTNPAIVSELRFFGPPNAQLTKDLVRFRTGNRRDGSSKQTADSE
jgi:MoxR-vWA-beta-propeller ternary system domain bpX3